jgi:hypothetical protein
MAVPWPAVREEAGWSEGFVPAADGGFPDRQYACAKRAPRPP